MSTTDRPLLLTPFRGLRYGQDDETITAPPYDVIDAAEAASLRAADPHNVVYLDLPVVVGDAGTTTGAGGEDSAGASAVDAAHARAGALLQQWVDDGVLSPDPDPVFYRYEQVHEDDDGTPRRTAGVVGALAIGDDRVQPHEEITKKASSDRLTSLRRTQSNLSMIYGLSPAAALPGLLDLPATPVAEVTDEEGVVHRLGVFEDEDTIAALTEAVSSAPVVIADGHHRYMVAKHYIDTDPSAPAAADRIMTFVVPLDPAFLEVRPIHRSVPSVRYAGDELEARLEEIADVTRTDPSGAVDGVDSATIGLVAGDRAFLLHPRLRDEDRELVSGRPDVLRDLATVWVHNVLLPQIGADESVFHHDAGVVVGRVEAGSHDCAVLLAPVTVDKIIEIAQASERTPPKTTFFWPKARTGLVLRRFIDQGGTAT